MRLDRGQHWLISFYHHSELSGGLFFARVARSVAGAEREALLHHASDELRHAAWWARCLSDHAQPLAMIPYQERYAAAGGVPTSFAEVLALTQVFEERSLAQYTAHLADLATPPPVRAVLERLVADEARHLGWIHARLAERADDPGLAAALTRFRACDVQVRAEVEAEFARGAGAA